MNAVRVVATGTVLVMAGACSVVIGLGDVPVASDGGMDAGLDASEGGAFIDANYCSRSDATFCDDFDTTALAIKWESLNVTPPASLDIVPFDAAPSPPNTLLGIIPSPDAGGGAGFVTRHFVGTYTHIGLSFMVRLEQTDPYPSHVTPFGIEVNDPVLGYYHAYAELYWNGDAGGASAWIRETDQLPDGGMQGQQTPSLFQAPVLGKWSLFEIRIDAAPDGGPPSMVILLDTVVVLTSNLLPGWTFGPKVELDFGMFYGSSPNSQARFDNVEARVW